MATDLDRATTSGMSEPDAVALLRTDAGAYDPALLEAAGTGRPASSRNLQLVTVGELRREMTIAADVVSKSGALLIGRGSRSPRASWSGCATTTRRATSRAGSSSSSV